MPDRSAGVRWRAPGRVNLIGEHTDYNDGFCLPLAIEAACTATVSMLDEPVLEVVSAQLPDPVELPLDALAPRSLAGSDAWAGYPAGVVWALRERGHRLGGLSIDLDSEVPTGAGLSSSAALECSVAGAVNDLFDLGLAGPELVSVARQAENDFVGAPTGGMDQLASVFGQAGHVLLCDMRSLRVEPVPFDLAGAGLTLLVTDTRATHQLTDGGYGERRSDCEQAARQLGVPALRGLRRAAAAGPAARDRPAAVRLARQHARRLREHRAGGGPGRRGDAGLRRVRRPDDRRRLRRLRDRAVRAAPGPGRGGGHRRRLRRPPLHRASQLRGAPRRRAAPSLNPRCRSGPEPAMPIGPAEPGRRAPASLPDSGSAGL
jgi:galactokinase